MNKIEKKQIYLDYINELEEINESKNREKKIQNAVEKIHKFLKQEDIIKFLIDKVVDRNTPKGVKYLVWLADLVKKDILEKYKNKEDMKKYLETNELNPKYNKISEYEANNILQDFIVNDYLDEYWDDLMQQFVPPGLRIITIVDWLKSPLRESELILSDFKTLEEVWIEAKEWHDNLEGTGIVDNEHGKILKTFDDGFYWIDLETTEDKDEASAMGHCGITTDGTTLYSLRKAKSPHVTMAIDTEKGLITQCKGRNNAKPVKKYHPYIVDLMMDKNFKADKFFLEYDTGQDFEISDLDIDLFKKLINHNIKWLLNDGVDEKYGIYYLPSEKMYESFKDDKEFWKKIPYPSVIFKFLSDLFYGAPQGKYPDRDKLLDFFKTEIFTEEFLNKRLIGGINHLKIEGDDIVIREPFSNTDGPKKFMDHKHYYRNLKIKLESKIWYSFMNKDAYIDILLNFWNLPQVVSKLRKEINTNLFYTDTLIKFKKSGVGGMSKLKKIYDDYINSIFCVNIEKEQKLILNYIKELSGVELTLDERGYTTSKTNIKDFIKYKSDRAFSMNDIITTWNLGKGYYIKEYSQYTPKYDLIKDINEYVLKELEPEVVTESVINEKFGVASDIEEWYNLIYYVLTVQINGFVEAVTKDPETFEKVLQIDDEEADVYTAEIGIPEKEINKLIDERISKTNKLKLRDLSLNFSLTILPEEHFTNYLFASDAFYSDADGKFDGTYLKNCEIYVEIYLPEEVFEEDIEIKDILSDYEINLKARQSLSHELDHAYEFFNKIATGSVNLPENEINQIRKVLSDAPFSKISQDFENFLYLVYLGLSFEGSARVTQIYYQLKEYKIDTEAYFWSVVKDSLAWKDLVMLRDFNPTEFYNNIKFEMSDEDIKDVLIETKLYTEKDFQKNTIKDLVVRHWLELFDGMIEDVNRQSKVKISRINKQMFDHPLLFFKHYDKKFKKSWEYFYNRIIRMSVAYIPPKKN